MSGPVDVPLVRPVLLSRRVPVSRASNMSGVSRGSRLGRTGHLGQGGQAGLLVGLPPNRGYPFMGQR